jgi:DNA mismatch repair protein MutS2
MLDKDGLSVTLDVSDIELLAPDKSRKQKSTSSSGIPSSSEISYELDLRGLQVDEALESVEAYLDRAVLSTWSEVRIIHGKGTGALREAIHCFLSGQKNIASYRLGNFGEGDSGVTVVQLK